MVESRPGDDGAYRTRGGVQVRCEVEKVDGLAEIEELTAALDTRRGGLFASSFEYPGRYTRWDMGFLDPPLALVARGREARLIALNERGCVLIPAIARAFEALPATAALASATSEVRCTIREPTGRFPEEERSKQPSIFSLLRGLIELFGSDEDAHLGLYGAFGYDLALQFEPLRLRLERPENQRDLVLYLPDHLLLVDHRRELATRRRYLRLRGGWPLDARARAGGHRTALRRGRPRREAL
jgi:anthranilate synthase